ncbi:hypothetical protein VTH06DRAFT_7540 [Thermothelomyces fergusii]
MAKVPNRKRSVRLPRRDPDLQKSRSGILSGPTALARSSRTGGVGAGRPESAQAEIVRIARGWNGLEGDLACKFRVALLWIIGDYGVFAFVTGQLESRQKARHSTYLPPAGSLQVPLL